MGYRIDNSVVQYYAASKMYKHASDKQYRHKYDDDNPNPDDVSIYDWAHLIEHYDSIGKEVPKEVRNYVRKMFWSNKKPKKKAKNKEGSSYMASDKWEACEVLIDPNKSAYVTSSKRLYQAFKDSINGISTKSAIENNDVSQSLISRKQIIKRFAVYEDLENGKCVKADSYKELIKKGKAAGLTMPKAANLATIRSRKLGDWVVNGKLLGRVKFVYYFREIKLKTKGG